MNQKVILLTGGESGIGRVTAHTLARDGHRVIIVDRDEDDLTACEQVIDGLSTSSPTSPTARTSRQ